MITQRNTWLNPAAKLSNHVEPAQSTIPDDTLRVFHRRILEDPTYGDFSSASPPPNPESFSPASEEPPAPVSVEGTAAI